MTVPRSETQPQCEQQTSDGRVDATSVSGSVTLQIEGDAQYDSRIEFAVLVEGDLRRVADVDDGATVTALETNATLLTGHVDGTALEYVATGDLLGVTVDDPAPTITLDGTPVDTARWPAVHQAIGRGAHQEPVATPFPDSGEMGKPLGDPLDPKEYAISIEAADGDGPRSYSFDVDGAVVEHPTTATVAADGSSVAGDLAPGGAVQLEVRGAVTSIETGDGVDVTFRPLN